MKKTTLSILLLISISFFAKAQVSGYAFTQSMDTFQLITGTVVDIPSEDDVYHPNLPIGFPYTYNGVTTGKFGICTNGYIVMDSLFHGAQLAMASNATNMICIAFADLRNVNNGGTIEYATIGTAPNRVLVVQWKDYGIFGMSYCHLNFQIRLHENTSCVQFVYGLNGVSSNNINFNVGLIGSNTDFNLRSTSNDWTLTSPNTSFPGSPCHMGPISILPSGLVFSFGSCPATGTAFSYISGKVFNDANNNGVQDSGENGMPNILIHESLQNIYATTDANGDYNLVFLDSTHTYSLSATPYTYWSITTTPAVQTVTPLSQSCVGHNFGMYATPNMHDVAITSWASNVPWPNALINFYTTFHNQGTAIESDTILFHSDSMLHFISATPAPSFVNGTTIGWLYSNLQIQEYRNIHLVMKSDSMVSMGDTLYSNWLIQPIAGDQLTSNNTHQHIQACLSSFDPNSKDVYPTGAILNTQTLEYTINFQNTGTFMASNIFVTDDLDPNLDITSFHVAGSSHPMTYSITNSGHVVFVFNSINLPDSNSNEAASHGYIRYSIKPLNSLTPGATIHNTAAIRFDFNAPVSTNTTVNTIKSNDVNGITTSTINKVDAIQLFPNPTADLVKVFNPNLKYTHLQLINMNGQVVLSEIIANKEYSMLSTITLANGTYLVQARNAKGDIAAQELIKIAR